MKIFEFNKLIRNKLPEKMRKEGVEIFPKSLPEEEYFVRLCAKLSEEALEVAESSTDEELTIELADVLEVLLSIAGTRGISMADIEKAARLKREANGSFDKETYVDFIKVPLEAKKVIDYLTDKKRPYVFKEEG